MSEPLRIERGCCERCVGGIVETVDWWVGDDEIEVRCYASPVWHGVGARLSEEWDVSGRVEVWRLGKNRTCGVRSRPLDFARVAAYLVNEKPSRWLDMNDIVYGLLYRFWSEEKNATEVCENGEI